MDILRESVLNIPAVTDVRVNGDNIEYDIDGETITTALPDKNTWITGTTADTGIINNYVDINGLKYFKEKLLEEIYSKPLVEHVCHNCGAKLTVESDKHIFHCKYCGSCYAFGLNMING